MRSHVPDRMRLAATAAALAALVIACAAEPVFAVSPKYWIHDSADELLMGELDGVSVTSDGALRLAPRVDTLAELDEPYIWDVAVDGAGNAYLGTGDAGWIIRVRGDEQEPFFQCAALEVLSVIVGPGGNLFAGSGAEGFVYKIGPDGTGSILFDAEEQYVWDLAFGPDGKLYAALGANGVVYRIDPSSGEADRFFETDENHVVCLAFEDSGDLLVGTEGKGLVIRVSPAGKVGVLYDCPQSEVGAVLAGKNGEVWAAAATSTEARNGRLPDSNADGTGLDNSSDFSFDILPASADEGVLYRIAPSGNAFQHWESRQSSIFDLALGENGDVLATTGEEGAVFAVHADGRATLIFDAEEEQVVSIVDIPGESSHYLATANPSRLHRMSSEFRREGTYLSEVLDARRLARWGRIEWTGESNGGAVKLSARSGNTSEPDPTWSDWTEVDKDDGSLAGLGRSRFLQWRTTLKGGGSKAPRVLRVRVSSLEENLPPIVMNVRVVPAGNRFYDDVPEIRPRPLYQALPGGVKVQYSFDHGGDEEFPPEQRAPWAQGLRQVWWDAADPNGDFLVFDLAFRRDDEARWKEFAADIEGKNYTFNTEGVPDGSYRIRVIASDRRFNPNDEKTASQDSEFFVVDNTAPDFRDIKHKRDGSEIRITGTLSDQLSDVVRFEFSVNGEDWVDRPPEDGIFDSSAEKIELKVEAPSGDEHSVMLRGTDLAGNLGSTRVLIEP